MEILFDQNPTFLWPIDVRLPTNGTWQSHRLWVCYRLLGQQELVTLLDKSGNDDRAVLDKLVASLHMDETSPALDPGQTDRLLDFGAVQQAILQGYQVAVMEEEEKNS